MTHRTCSPVSTAPSAGAPPRSGRTAGRRATLRRLVLVLATLASLAPALRAQPPAAAPVPPLTAAVRTQVIDSLRARLAARYVDADTATRVGALLHRRLRTGAYDTLATTARFAEVVTRDLRTINGDLHLRLRYDPQLAGELRAEEASAPPDGTPPRVPPPSGGPPDRFTLEARQHNYGLAKVEILPLNIGYLEIEQFMGAEGVDAAVADALRFLARTDAVIIDVRRNGGGSGDMSHYLLSHFLGPKSVPTIRIVDRGEGDTTVLRSVEEVAGPRRPDVPLYVLASQGTGSAAEEFSFVLQNLGRATIVGDRTAGAGHVVRTFDVGHGFVAGVSIARVTDPRSNREWERVGVQPDVRVPPEQAREAAYAHAMRTLAARTTDAERKTFLTRRAETIDAQLRAERPDVARLASFAGTYDGARVVRLSDGRLWYYRRPGVMPDELVPLGGSRFALQGATWLTFETTGDGARMLVDRADGTKATYLRTAPATTSSATTSSATRAAASASGVSR